MNKHARELLKELIDNPSYRLVNLDDDTSGGCYLYDGQTKLRRVRNEGSSQLFRTGLVDVPGKREGNKIFYKVGNWGKIVYSKRVKNG